MPGNCRDLPNLLKVNSCEKSISRKNLVLPMEKLQSLVLPRNVINTLSNLHSIICQVVTYVSFSLSGMSVNQLGVAKCMTTIIKHLTFDISMAKQERQNKKGSYVSNSKKGGINFVNFCTVIKALLLAQIGRLLSTSDDNWKAIPNYCFRKHGSLLFLLICNYDIKLLKTGLPLFFRELLQYF